MSGRNATSLGRLHELLADRATQALSAVERDELLELLDRHPEVDATSYDRAAAALDLPYAVRQVELMPAAVREKVEAGAIAWLARSRGLTVVEGGSGRSAPDTARSGAATASRPRPNSRKMTPCSEKTRAA